VRRIKVPKLRVNTQIQAPTVRLVDVDGTQLGVKPLSEALAIAQSKELDLLEIAPQVSPPTCRIVDYSKYLYQLEKKLKQAGKKQRATQIKEIRLRPHISDHDLEIKLQQLKKFLTERHKVRVNVLIYGREKQHLDLVQQLIEKIKQHISPLGYIEQEPPMRGHQLPLIIAPVK